MIFIDAEFISFTQKEWEMNGKHGLTRELSFKDDDGVKILKSASVSKDIDINKLKQFKMGDSITLKAKHNFVKAMSIPFTEKDTSKEVTIPSYVVFDIELQ